jgi:hypothetical protein
MQFLTVKFQESVQINSSPHVRKWSGYKERIETQGRILIINYLSNN